MRILSEDSSDIRPNPRVEVLGEDSAGFTRVRAFLGPNEGLCWRCASIANDPNHDLEICPHCGKDFND